MEVTETVIIYSFGLGLVGFVFAFTTWVNFLRVKNYQKPSIVPIKDLTPGVHEVHGEIVALEQAVTSPWQEEESVFFNLNFSELDASGRHRIWRPVIDDLKYVKTGVRDDSGCLEIMLHRAEIRCAQKKEIQEKELFPEAHVIAAKYNKKLPASKIGMFNHPDGSSWAPFGYRLMESCLPVGTMVYVTGETEIRDDHPPLMQTVKQPMIVANTSLSEKARPPLAVFKVTLILAITCFVLVQQLLCGNIPVEDVLKGILNLR